MIHTLCFDHQEELDRLFEDDNFMGYTYICSQCGEEHYDDEQHHLECIGNSSPE